MAQYALDTRDAFPLTLRFSKCAIVVPVQPSTSVSELKTDIVEAIRALTASGRILHEANGWEQVGGRDPASELEKEHIGIFRGSAAPGVNAEERGNVAPGWEPPNTFQRVDSEKAAGPRSSSSSGPSVSSLGFKAGSDQLAYLGFAPKGSNTIARPVYVTPAFLDEDEEEEEGEPDSQMGAGAGDAEADNGADDQEEEDGGEEDDEDEDAWIRAGVTLGSASAGPS
ncbi:unnamed protein product [Tilletia controversa]|uniref:Uncharacterized protein n=3 Tax=Tilletia TaxID=13289 RepID=A0A8X7MRJ7_9BASI|nr:hypothetical protein CF336_g4706 [Tilletia laevis]KAE8195038.1 hypothetical protein CF328_g4564 [Tilletia controversa]KAE8256675.1 hypothetical protein A4X03_0g5168 [Tilletia caries]KAE8199468.1 hypothetical protein CF335_g4167 [Tilletia laevis]KAE8246229.1 hypothetical protein A4X06_0g5100 [Tilletia controversa]